MPLTALAARVSVACDQKRRQLSMASHRSVAKLSLHISRLASPAARPPHSTSPGRVPSHSFAPPARAALHTPVRRQAPMSPLNSATRAHTSERDAARSMVHLDCAWVVVWGAMGACALDLCLCMRAPSKKARGKLWEESKLCRSFSVVESQGSFVQVWTRGRGGGMNCPCKFGFGQTWALKLYV